MQCTEYTALSPNSSIFAPAWQHERVIEPTLLLNPPRPIHRPPRPAPPWISGRQNATVRTPFQSNKSRIVTPASLPSRSLHPVSTRPIVATPPRHAPVAVAVAAPSSTAPPNPPTPPPVCMIADDDHFAWSRHIASLPKRASSPIRVQLESDVLPCPDIAASAFCLQLAAIEQQAFLPVIAGAAVAWIYVRLSIRAVASVGAKAQRGQAAQPPRDISILSATILTEQRAPHTHTHARTAQHSTTPTAQHPPQHSTAQHSTAPSTYCF